MIDVVMTTIAGAFHGVGNLIEGIFGKYPKMEDLRAQAVALSKTADQMKEVFRKQNEEIATSLAVLRSLKFYQFMQKSELRSQIQEELVCQYAAYDYLALLIDTVESGKKMSRSDLDFYLKYCKLFADGRIDADELAELRPIMMERHSREIEDLRPCDLDFVLDRFCRYKN